MHTIDADKPERKRQLHRYEDAVAAVPSETEKGGR
jgi:hypothetical protein